MKGDGQGMWHVSEEETCTLGLVGKAEGKRPFARPCCRLEDNIKMDFMEIG
jgi:hypothetical protein